MSNTISSILLEIDELDDCRNTLKEFLETKTLSTQDRELVEYLAYYPRSVGDYNLITIVEEYNCNNKNIFSLISSGKEQLEIDDINGEFYIYRCLGIGSRGIVFHVKSRIYSDFNIVVKCMKNEEREIDILKSLNGNLYVTPFLFGMEINNIKYIVIKFLPNYQILDFIEAESKHQHRFTEQYALFLSNIIRNLIDGLRSLHSQEIVHRDIKTNNILYSPEGEIRYIDFDSSYHKNQIIGEIPCAGTPEFRDLHITERMYKFEEISYDEFVKGDYWALGITILTIVSGTDPYDVYGLNSAFDFKPAILRRKMHNISREIIEIQDKFDLINQVSGMKFNIHNLLELDPSKRILTY